MTCRRTAASLPAVPPALTILLDVLFPPRCAACDELLPARETGSRPLELCEPCETSLVPVTEACARCGLPGEAVDQCRRCLAELPSFDGASSVWAYDGAITQVLHRFKYEHRPHYAGPLGAQLAALPLPDADVVTYVPLHPSRRRFRTYDQALYLARQLATARGLPCESLLKRVRATGRQVGRSRSARLLNVDGAFLPCGPVAHRSVLLVDDVVTTGATAEACAQALVDAGARRVHLVCVARAAP